MRSSTALAWIVILYCGFVAPPMSAQPDAYAQHWPVQVKEVGMYAVTLTPALYEQIDRRDLGDLAAFNGAGESLGFESLASVWKRPESNWEEAHWFTLPAARPDQGESLAIQVERRSDGSVSLRGEVGEPASTAAVGDLLVDTGIEAEADLRLLALSFQLDPEAFDLNASIRIDASHELESWRTVVESAVLLRLQQDGQLLERRRVELPSSSERYLRIHRLDAQKPIPLTGLEVQTQAASVLAPQPTERLSAELVSSDKRTFTYRMPARIPVEEVQLRLSRDNTMTVASLAAREGEKDSWRSMGKLTAFRLRAEGVELDNEPLPLSGSRYRHWRVSVTTDLVDPPELEFSYRPERWLLLTQGEAPYVIAAGSSRAVRDSVPMSALLAPIRAKYGADWQPPEANLGAPRVVAGEAAIETSADIKAKERWSGMALWLVLIVSALAIAFMVLRLLGERPPEGEG